MNWNTLSVFASGIFFGGAIDHMIRAAKGEETTPYGIRSGVWGTGPWPLSV